MGERDRGAASKPRRRGAVLTLLLLDTSALIDAEHLGVDLDDLIADDDEPAVAAITIAELGVGVEIATGRRRQARRAFLDDLIDALPIIDYHLAVARAHTKLLVAVRRSGRPRAHTT